MPNPSSKGVSKATNTSKNPLRPVVNDARDLDPPAMPTPTPSPKAAYDSLSLNGPQPEIRILDMWVFCQQLSALYAAFLDKATASPVTRQCPKIFLKTVMFRAAAEANIVANALKVLVEKYTTRLDMGQHQASQWSLIHAPAFNLLLAFTDRKASEVFGGALAGSLNQGRAGKKVRQPYTAEVGHSYVSDPMAQGIRPHEDKRIIREIGVQCDIWESAIEGFKGEFNPLHPQSAVVLMADTASLLRQAAASTSRLVDCDYRFALGLSPIEGTAGAEKVYQAIIHEQKIDLDVDLRAELLQISRSVETRYEVLLRKIESGDGGVDPVLASQGRMESQSWREQVEVFPADGQGLEGYI